MNNRTGKSERNFCILLFILCLFPALNARSQTYKEFYEQALAYAESDSLELA